jgi:hypothetical protein
LRRERQRLERKKGTRAGLPALLIVCEGKETEPNYLRGLCEIHRINAANVIIVPGDGDTDALRLVAKARRRFEVDRDFDAVFVICDCAGEDLATAKALAAKPLKTVSKATLTVQLIVSRPSFEFWLLLHFEYAARPFQTAAETILALRAHITDYSKSDRDIFLKVQSGLDRARANVARLKAELQATGALLPDSDMAELVEMLMTLRARR